MSSSSSTNINCFFVLVLMFRCLKRHFHGIHSKKPDHLVKTVNIKTNRWKRKLRKWNIKHFIIFWNRNCGYAFHKQSGWNELCAFTSLSVLRLVLSLSSLSRMENKSAFDCEVREQSNIKICFIFCVRCFVWNVLGWDFWVWLSCAGMCIRQIPFLPRLWLVLTWL